jgi:hypothetical protein
MPVASAARKHGKLGWFEFPVSKTQTYRTFLTGDHNGSARLAQLVEHSFSKREVPSSNLGSSNLYIFSAAPD